MNIHIRLDEMFREEYTTVVVPTSPKIRLVGGIGGTCALHYPKEYVDSLSNTPAIAPGSFRMLDQKDDLNQNVILVCNTMVNKNDVSNSKGFLTKLIIKVINYAKEIGLNSIAFPLLGSGAYKYSKGESAGAILNAFKEFRFDDYDMDLYLIFYITDKNAFYNFRQDIINKKFDFDFSNNASYLIPHKSTRELGEEERNFAWMRSNVNDLFQDNRKSLKFYEYFDKLMIMKQVRDIDVYTGICSKTRFYSFYKDSYTPTREESLLIGKRLKLSYEELVEFLQKSRNTYPPLTIEEYDSLKDK